MLTILQSAGLHYPDTFALARLMRTIRIYIDLPLAAGAEVALPERAAEHVARVLRLGVGDAVTLFNGNGSNYLATILVAGKRRVTLMASAEQDAANESPLAMTLAQAVVRGEKMDWIVQKATELGVVRIVPLLTERAQVHMDSTRAQKRWEHWRAVAVSASEQSGRARVPEIIEPVVLQEWLTRLPANPGLLLTLWPQAQVKMRDLRFTSPCGTLVVGPEGGLGERDLRVLREGGFTSLSLGPRILRTETAGLAALAALQAVHGDW